MAENARHISTCLGIVEQKMSWGPASEWTNYDFERLSETIFEKTGTRLSVTTLKRIFGKVKYENAPTLTTLNALAKFVEHDDWRSFVSAIASRRPGQTTESSQVTLNPPKAGREKSYGLVLLIILTGVLVLIVSSYILRPPTPDPKDFQFRASKMITEGVPNSVVFSYNAEAASTDSVFIVQTWDVRRKKLVRKDKHEHSAIYYYPGFFRTKLIADRHIVKTHDLWITSDGWLCLAENEPVPIYFKKDEYIKTDRVEVNDTLLTKYNLALHPSAPRLRFYHQKDLGDLTNDNFVFETSLKTTLNSGAAACQIVQVLIQCKDDIIVIPLSSKSCVGDMSLIFAGYEANSSEADLSGFGSNLSEWTDLKIETVNKKATIFVNNQVAYQLSFPNDPTGIVGVQFRFRGTGAVRDTKFSRGEKVFKF